MNENNELKFIIALNTVLEQVDDEGQEALWKIIDLTQLKYATEIQSLKNQLLKAISYPNETDSSERLVKPNCTLDIQL